MQYRDGLKSLVSIQSLGITDNKPIQPGVHFNTEFGLVLVYKIHGSKHLWAMWDRPDGCKASTRIENIPGSWSLRLEVI
jgi:hypothetical protein